MTTQKKKETSQSQVSGKKDEDVLFPEVDIDGIIVKPWSFGMLFDISGSLEIVLDKVEEKGIDLTGFIPYTTFARLFTIAGPEVLKIISLTIGKEEEEIKELDMSTGVRLAMVIYQQNKEIIKNALAPLLKEKEEEEEKTTN